jgi:hypothetical protein
MFISLIYSANSGLHKRGRKLQLSLVIIKKVLREFSTAGLIQQSIQLQGKVTLASLC